MNWYLILRFLHIASAIALVGGVFARQFVRMAAYKADDVRDFAAMSQAAGRIESLMVIPGSLAVIVIGVLLALQINAPILGFLQGASQNWLLVSNLLLLFGVLAVPLVFVPRGKRFDPILREALAAGQITPQLRAALNDPVVRFAHWYEMISLVIVVFLMVFRPF
jgi:uncharacterized membrane protein